MLKYLCTAVTALSLTACLLLMALWVRSYWIWEQVSTSQWSEFPFAVESFRGDLRFWTEVAANDQWTFTSRSIKELLEEMRRTDPQYNFLLSNGWVSPAEC